MKRYFSICLVVGLLGLLINPIIPSYAEAVENTAAVDNAFEIDYPVKDHSQAEWDTVVKQTLPQLLVKISGDPKIAEAPLVKEGLAKPAKYVRSYSYTTQKAENGKLPLVLHLTYDERAINRLLNQIQQTAPPTQTATSQTDAAELTAEVGPAPQTQADKIHPVTLIWLAVKTLKHDYVLSNSTEDIVAQTLKAGTARRELPIVLPLMDLTDWANMSQVDIAKLDPALLETASKRYSPEIVLEGQLIQTQPKYWEGQWALNIKGENLRWNTEGESIENVIDSALEDVVNNVKARLSNTVATQEDSTLKIKIMGVEGLEDYADVVSYLRSLAFISKVEVIDVGADNVVVELTTNGKVENIDSLLSQDNKLQPEIVNKEVLSPETGRVYRWVRQQPVLPAPDPNLEPQ